ncbi:recombinase RecT [Actinophytocola sp.]|uniref:recombinase RecT n=1 Tax=Actinophytocola sp. TaxID=1872138 RepID=UPI002D23DCEE|nr:recombinase RecT [Actinophytocola sp.]HYQ69099.1 recombinase RecT [Actinophytocola sp.]
MSNATARNELAAVREQREQSKAPALVQMLENPRWAQAFADASPKGAEATQVIRDVMTVARKTPKLLECNAMSVIGAAMTCAQLGLRVAVMGHAWILPFKQQAQLVIGYQGYRELAFRSGIVESMMARPVHEHDFFEVHYGVEDTLLHRPPKRGTERGEITDYYAIVKYTNGGHAFWTMSKQEVERHRDRFALQKDFKTGEVKGPWKDHFDQMAAKTCFLQLARWMPKSTEMAMAIEADNKVRVDTSPDGIHSGYVPNPDGSEPIEADVVEE